MVCMYVMVSLCSLCWACFRAVAFTLTELQLLKCLTPHAQDAGDMWPINYKCKTAQEILMRSIELWPLLALVAL